MFLLIQSHPICLKPQKVYPVGKTTPMNYTNIKKEKEIKKIFIWYIIILVFSKVICFVKPVHGLAES